MSQRQVAEISDIFVVGRLNSFNVCNVLLGTGDDDDNGLKAAAL
jgi:hypothetical protein